MTQRCWHFLDDRLLGAVAPIPFIPLLSPSLPSFVYLYDASRFVVPRESRYKFSTRRNPASSFGR
jgi:hypothetical protein